MPLFNNDKKKSEPQTEIFDPFNFTIDSKKPLKLIDSFQDLQFKLLPLLMFPLPANADAEPYNSGAFSNILTPSYSQFMKLVKDN